MHEPFTTGERLASPAARGGIALAALVGLGLCVVGAWFWPQSFWPGYHTAVVFWLSLSLGCLSIALLHALTEGRWGWGISRELHAGMAPLFLTPLFVAPLVFGARWIFPWIESRAELNPHQQQYLDPRLVLVRTAISWLVWCGLIVWLMSGYRRIARDADDRVWPRGAAFGLLGIWATVSTAAIDGLMSLDTGWASSMFGAIQVVGCAVGGMAWVIVLRGLLHRGQPDDTSAQLSHDVGNLLMAFTLMWVYLSFSEYLIIWSGDLPHETYWYAARQTGLAGMVGTALLLFHFVVPFALLLSIGNKRHPQRLAAIAGILLVMRVVSFGWIVFPAEHGSAALMLLSLVASGAVIGTLWVAVCLRQYRRLPSLSPTLLEAHAAPVETSMEPAP